MPFQYSCFISYCRGQGALMRDFMLQLKDALEACTEPYLDQKVFLDHDNLAPGGFYNEELARAIAASVCMIVVYVPKYERHPYCLREFAAMEILEDCRNRLRADLPKMSFIVPIVLRVHGDLPDRITRARTYSDFSKYSTASKKILEHEEHVAQIEKIAAYIYSLYCAFDAVTGDVSHDCPAFRIPEAHEIAPMRPPAEPPYPR